MTEIHGIQLPAKPPAQIRQGMPQPFQRPSIDLGGGSEIKREWRTLAVTEIAEGDIIPGIGVVTYVEEYIKLPETTLSSRSDQRTAWTVTIRGGEGNERVYQGHETVLAFTA